MPCVLIRKTDPTVFFEGPAGDEVTIKVKPDGAGTAVRLISLLYDGTSIAIKKNCATVTIKRGTKSVDYKIESRPSRAWVRLVEACESCGSEKFKVMSRFKTQDPPMDRQLIIEGV